MTPAFAHRRHQKRACLRQPLPGAFSEHGPLLVDAMRADAEEILVALLLQLRNHRRKLGDGGVCDGPRAALTHAMCVCVCERERERERERVSE